MWAVSVAVHSTLVLIITLTRITANESFRQIDPEFTVDTSMQPREEFFIEKLSPHRDIFSGAHETENGAPSAITEAELVAPEPVALDQPESREGLATETDLEHEQREEAISIPEPDISIPSELMTFPVATGRRPSPAVGQGMRTPLPSGRYRPGEPVGLGPGAMQMRGEAKLRLKAAECLGGGIDTENAVRKALKWLAINQNRTGSWSRNGRRGKSDGGLTGGQRLRWEKACTGLAALAFMGAGHSPKSKTRHSRTVTKALRFLVGSQRRNGSFGQNADGKLATDLAQGRHGGDYVCMYVQGIAVLALCEAYALTGSKKLGAAAQRGVDFIQSQQGKRAAWDYVPSASRNRQIDASVTIWCFLALNSGRLSGLKIKPSAFRGIRNWLDGSQLLHSGQEGQSGAFAYRGSVSKTGQVQASKGTCGGTMTAAGLMMRIYTGCKRSDRRCRAPAGLLLANFTGGPKLPENSGERINSVTKYEEDIYFFYHASVPMFQMGGTYWKRWNLIAKKHLLPAQTRNGSWPGVRCYSSTAMATALGAMSMEVYYRYLRIYDRVPDRQTAELTASSIRRGTTGPQPATRPGK